MHHKNVFYHLALVAMQVVLDLGCSRYLSLKLLPTSQYNGGQRNLMYAAQKIEKLHLKHNSNVSVEIIPVTLDNLDTELPVNCFHRNYFFGKKVVPQ